VKRITPQTWQQAAITFCQACGYFRSFHQMALPVNGSTHLIPAYYSFIDPERMKGSYKFLQASLLPTEPKHLKKLGMLFSVNLQTGSPKLLTGFNRLTDGGHCVVKTAKS